MGAASNAEALSGTVLGSWRLVRLVDGGGMGAIYRGEHVRFRTPVAVKVLLPAWEAYPGVVARFEREALIGAQVVHPNLVRTLDLLDDGQRKYLIMEWLDGESLARRLSRGPCTLAEAVPIFAEACAGVAAAHAAGVVHRDLKPGNIFLAREAGRTVAKVLDFGISKLEADGGKLTRSGAVMGSPLYMSPEQFASTKHVGPRTDVYAMGLVLYEMLAGANPFEGDPAAIPLRVCTMPLPPHPRIPDGLFHAIRRATEKQAAARHAEITDLRREVLEAAASPAPPKVAPEEHPTEISDGPPVALPMHATQDATTALRRRAPVSSKRPERGAQEAATAPDARRAGWARIGAAAILLSTALSVFMGVLSRALGLSASDPLARAPGWVVAAAALLVSSLSAVALVRGGAHATGGRRPAQDARMWADAAAAYAEGLSASFVLGEGWAFAQVVALDAPWRDVALRREAHRLLLDGGAWAAAALCVLLLVGFRLAFASPPRPSR